MTIEKPGHPVNCHNSVPLSDYVADAESSSSDSLDGLKTLRSKHLRNSFLSHLNINHLCNKIIDLRHILRQIVQEYISISELDEQFPDTQFKIEGYHHSSFRIDRTRHGGGLMVFVKSDIIVTRRAEYEPNEIESICTKITIAKNIG